MSFSFAFYDSDNVSKMSNHKIDDFLPKQHFGPNFSNIIKPVLPYQ